MNKTVIPLNIKKYFHKVNYILGKDRNKILWLVPLFLFSSILDLLGISLVATFVTILTNHDRLSGKFFAPYLGRIKFMGNDELKVAIFVGCFFIILAFFTKTVTAILINKKIFRLCFDQTVKLRSYLMSAYQEMNYVDYLRRNSSEYVYNIQTIVGQFAVSITQSLLRIISDGVICLAIIVFLAINDWQSLSILIVLLAALIVCYDKFFKNKNKLYGIISNKFSTRMVQAIQEGMNGFRENRIYGTAHYFNKMVNDNAKGLADARVKSQVITTSSQYVVEFVLILFVVLLVLVSVLTGRTVDSIIATIAVFAIAAMRLMPSANQILSCATKIRYGKNTVDILYNDLKKIDSNRVRQDFEKYDLACRKNTKIAHSNCNNFNVLRLRNVEFTYPGNLSPTLSNINLEIGRGTSVGIIGMSGSGKTTLVDIILGLLKPQGGEILFDHTPVDDNSCNWMSEFAYLPQDVFIVDDTLRNNIALGVPGCEIDDKRVINALKQSRLEDLVNNLPNGIHSVVGERGMRLSGGQRQRIAIARAFYHNRKILVMDESTSALDDKTEKEVVDEISLLKGSITLIVIAHRLTTLKHCDIIYEIDNGRIVRKGDYEKIVGTNMIGKV
ncbi:MAG: ABC transporter ATP-binding protein [Desulfovibrionales bacterium]|nr:ABC transporter ATP-binding protein [Desulfovibrionales bacterium]